MNFKLSELIQKIPYLWQALLFTLKSNTYNYWLAGLAITGFLLSYRRKFSRSEVFLSIALLGMAGLIIFGVAGWTVDLIKNSAITATYRLYVHILPAFLLLLISRIAQDDTQQLI